MRAFRLFVLGFAAASGAAAFVTHLPASGGQLSLVKAAYASDEAFLNGAESFVANLSSEAIGFLSDPNLNEVQKQNQFRKLLHSNFDMQTIGRFALGRYWRAAAPAQQNEYQKLFEKMVIGVYSSRFSEYRGQKVDVRSSRLDSEKDATVLSAIVQDSGPEVQLDWRVRYKDGRYRVIDVIVEGVSMAVTQRSEFSSVIQRGGGDVDVLLAHLREQ